MGAARKGSSSVRSVNENCYKFNIGFSGNNPECYTQEEYMKEAEHIQSTRMAQFNRSAKDKNTEDCEDYGYSPVDTQMCLEFLRPEGSISFHIDVYPDTPKWEDINVMNKLSYGALDELLNSVGTIDNTLWNYVIAGVKAGLKSIEHSNIMD